MEMKHDLISRQTLLRDIEKYHLSDGMFQHWVEVQPSVDAVEVVRCGECKHADAYYHCIFSTIWNDKNHYCSQGERKDG